MPMPLRSAAKLGDDTGAIDETRPGRRRHDLEVTLLHLPAAPSRLRDGGDSPRRSPARRVCAHEYRKVLSRRNVPPDLSSKASSLDRAESSSYRLVVVVGRAHRCGPS